jgi:hypothetical protein
MAAWAAGCFFSCLFSLSLIRSGDGPNIVRKVQPRRGAEVPLVWTGSGKNSRRLFAGRRFHLSRKQIQSVMVRPAVKRMAAADLWTTVGNAKRFPRLVHRTPRVRCQPAVHTFTPPLPPLRYTASAAACRIVQNRPRPASASQAPVADPVGYTSQKTRQDRAFAQSHLSPDVGRPTPTSPSTTAARQR